MIKISVTVPVYNAEKYLKQCLDSIQKQTLKEIEVIMIDDGSTDKSPEKIKCIIDGPDTEKVTLIRFRKNFGKAAALQAGFEKASGEIAITMDADLQDDPFEVPKLLAKMEEGYDVVSGWKQVRHDPMEKRLPSKLFNWVTAKMSGINIHDFTSKVQHVYFITCIKLNFFTTL